MPGMGSRSYMNGSCKYICKHIENKYLYERIVEIFLITVKLKIHIETPIADKQIAAISL